MKLYSYWRSSCSWRVRWALYHKGIRFEQQTVNLLTGEHLNPWFTKISPTGYLPALQLNDGTVLTESMAILEWLDEAFPTTPQLFPLSPPDRAIVRALSHIIVSGTQPLQNLKVMAFYSKDQNERNAFANRWINEGLAAYENFLIAKQCGGTFSFGASLTAADMCLVPQVYNAETRYGVDLRNYPNVERIYRHCVLLQSCIAASPERQPDAPK